MADLDHALCPSPSSGSSGNGRNTISHPAGVAEEGAGAVARNNDSSENEPGFGPAAVAHGRFDGDGVVVFDVTDRFITAVQTLQAGEVLKDGMFTLLESVSALEIMDPKLDSGYGEQQDGLEQTYDVTRSLLAEEVVGIMDQLLCHEMSWHVGYPLSQTLFTSFYIEAVVMPPPSSIVEADFQRKSQWPATRPALLSALRAYCLALLKTCHYVLNELTTETATEDQPDTTYYEEEDFVTATFHRPLLEEIDVNDIVAEIDIATAALAQSVGVPLPPVLDAILARLQLRRDILVAVEAPVEAEWWKIDPGPLAAVRMSHALGAPVPAAFSAQLQRNLASHMPPKPVIELGFEQACVHLQTLLDDCEEALLVVRFDDPQSLQTLLTAVSSKKKRQPLVYVRALMQNLLFSPLQDPSGLYFRHLLDDELALTMLPCNPFLDPANDEVEVVSDPRHVFATQLRRFRRLAAKPYLDLLRTLCQNRCRVRRRLCHLLRDWDLLQADARVIDATIHDAAATKAGLLLFYPPSLALRPVDDAEQDELLLPWPLTTWARLNKLRQMGWVVQLGFELELYQADELAAMYHHLHLISRLRLQLLSAIRTHTLRRLGRQGCHDAPAAVISLAYFDVAALDASATGQLAEALACVYRVLMQLSLVGPPARVRPYGSGELRHALRMRPLAAADDDLDLGPFPPAAEVEADEDEDKDAAREDMRRLLERARGAAAAARADVKALSRLPAGEAFSLGCHHHWLATSEDWLRACIAVVIAVAAVSTAVEHGGVRAEVPAPGKAYHQWWIVPQIVTIP